MLDFTLMLADGSLGLESFTSELAAVPRAVGPRSFATRDLEQHVLDCRHVGQWTSTSGASKCGTLKCGVWWMKVKLG